MNKEVRIIGKDDLDIEKIRAEITSLLESSHKMQAETLKINAETKWHSFYRVAIVWASAFAAAAAMITLAKAFL